MPGVRGENNELLLFGFVGDTFWDDGFTARQVVDALAEIGRGEDVTVRINSGGGFAMEGVAIFNALKAHRGKVEVIVESVAASAASIIAMAGESVLMRTGAVMMIHDPSLITIGTAADHEKSVEALETIAASMADIYAEKSGKTPARARLQMKAETWLTAEKAVEEGYADEVDKAEAAEPTAFDYRIYAHAPDRMAALADAKGWKFDPAAAGRKPRGAAPKRQKETPMTDAEKAAAAKAAADKEAADKAAAEAKAKAEADAKAKADAEAAATPDPVAAERKRAADITAACQLAGKPEKASAFIAEGKSLSDVVAALQAERPRTPEVSASNGNGAGKPSADTAAAWDKAVAKVNARIG